MRWEKKKFVTLGILFAFGTDSSMNPFSLPTLSALTSIYDRDLRRLGA
jgi:hypothetical protein